MIRPRLILLFSLVMLVTGCNRPNTLPAPTETIAPTQTLAATATAAATATPTPRPDPLAETEPASEILVVYPGDVIPAEAMAEIVDGFAADIGEGITVITEPFSDSGELTIIMEEVMPTLLITTPESPVEWLDGVDLAPFITSARWGMDDDLAEAQADAGSATRFPLLNSVMALYYDPLLAEELDVEPPTQWDTLIRDACKARDAERVGALLYPDARLYAALVAGHGGSLTDQAGSIDLTSEAALAAAKDMAALTADDCGLQTGRAYGSEPPPPSGPPLFSFGPLGQPPLAVIDPLNPDPVAIAPLPTRDAPAPALSVIGRIGSDDEAEQLAAWLFLRWLRDPAQQSTLAKATGLLPVSSDAEPPETLAAFDGAAAPALPGMAPLAEDQRLILEEGLVQIMGGADPEQTLAYLDELLSAQSEN